MGNSLPHWNEESDFEQTAKALARRTRRPRRAKSAAELLSQLMARRGFAQNQWSENLSHAWQDVAGACLSGHTATGNLNRGVLEIVVSNSSVMQQLAFEKHPLLKKIQQRLPEANIKDLRFRVGAV